MQDAGQCDPLPAVKITIHSFSVPRPASVTATDVHMDKMIRDDQNPRVSPRLIVLYMIFLCVNMRVIFCLFVCAHLPGALVFEKHLSLSFQQEKMLYGVAYAALYAPLGFFFSHGFTNFTPLLPLCYHKLVPVPCNTRMLFPRDIAVTWLTLGPRNKMSLTPLITEN